MKLRNAFAPLVVVCSILVPLVPARAQTQPRHHRGNPQNPPSQPNTAASSTNAPAPMFPSVTSYYPKVATPTQPATAVAPVAAAPVDPEVEAARKSTNAAKALAWQKEQAEAGSAYGQFQMGMHYMNGDGVTKDLGIARGWFLKSAKQGNDDAYEKLKNLDFPETVHAADGRVIQSNSARTDFMAQTGHPKGNPGFVIDYKTPIVGGGSDAPDNMQWAILADARKAEKWDELEPQAVDPATVANTAPAKTSGDSGADSASTPPSASAAK
jgi:TPR repeat protein